MLKFTANFIDGNWNPSTFDDRPFVYGPVVMGATAGVAKILTALNQVVKISLPPQYNIIFLGRLLVVIAALITAVFVYKLTRLFVSDYAALLATLVFSLSYSHIIHSHYYTTDVPLTLFITIVLYYSQKIFEAPSMKYYVLAGIFTALAFCTKFTAIVVCVPLLIAHIHSHYEQRRIFRIFADKKLLIFCIVLIVLIVLMLNYMIYPFSNISRAWCQLSKNAAATRRAEWGCVYPNRFIFYFYLVWVYFQPFMGIVALVGSIFVYLKCRTKSLPLLVFVVMYFGMHSLARNFSDRYLLPLIPLFSVIIGITLSALYNYVKPKILLKAVVALVIAVQVLIALYAAVRIDYIFTLPDTRALAAAWIRLYLRTDSSFIASELQGPRVRSLKISHLYTKGTGFYRTEKVDYLIHSTLFDKSLLAVMKCPIRDKYYQSLADNNKLIKTFWLESSGFIHPAIKILRTPWAELPPLYRFKIQPLHDLDSAPPMIFLDGIWAGGESGGFFISGTEITKSFIARKPVESVLVYLANQKDTTSRITIKTGLQSMTVAVNPHEKKLVPVQLSTAFPYIDYLYSIKMKNDKDAMIYAKIITDPLNESLQYWHLKQRETALTKLQVALSLEQDNPMLRYLMALLLYDSGHSREAMDIIRELGDDWLQSFVAVKMPDSKGNANGYRMNLYSVPPGHFKMHYSISADKSAKVYLNGKSVNQPEGLSSEAQQTFAINEPLEVSSFGCYKLGKEVSFSCNPELKIVNSEDNKKGEITDIRIIIDKEKLLKAMEEHSLSFSVFPDAL